MTTNAAIRAANNTSRRIDLDGGQVEILAAAAGGEHTIPRFRADAYNGGPMAIDGYSLPVVVDLAGLQQDQTVTANLYHRDDQIVGHCEKIHNNGRRLRVEGLVSGSGPAAVEFVENAKKGFPWRASVEVQPTAPLEELRRGEHSEVNGQTIVGPAVIARKGLLYGIGFVRRGADNSTMVSVAAQAAGGGGAMDFKEWLEQLGFSEDQLTDKQVHALRRRYDADIRAAAAGGSAGDSSGSGASGPRFDVAEIRAAHSDHLSNLEIVFARFEDGTVPRDVFGKLRSEALEAARAMKAKAIENRWPAGKLEVEAIRAAADVETKLIRAERPAGPAIISGGGVESGTKVIEAAILGTLGYRNLEKEYSDQILQAAHSEYRAIGLQEVILIAAQAAGYRGRQAITRGNLREILRYTFRPIEAGSSSWTTLSLSGILSAVANKELLAGYATGDDTWRMIAGVKSVSDFKTVTSYRLLDDGEYEEVKKSGEIAHGEVGEESYTRQARTYARMFTLTREDIINDDIGALDDLRTRIGANAFKKFNSVFWSVFMNNTSHFTSTRGNLLSGAAYALGADGALAAAELAFDKMQDNAANLIDVEADRILVPTQLHETARELFVSQNVNTGGSATKTKVPNRNVWEGMYQPVKGKRLGNSRFTNYSATTWYLLCNPEVLPTIVVSFLDGIQQPTVESSDADFDVLGVQFRGYHDFGADLAEWAGGLKVIGND